MTPIEDDLFVPEPPTWVRRVSPRWYEAIAAWQKAVEEAPGMTFEEYARTVAHPPVDEEGGA